MPMTANPPVPPLMLSMAATTVLKPADQARGVELNFDKPKLTDLPGAMRRMGWEVAPKLMEHWFAGQDYRLKKRDSNSYNANPMDIPPDRLDEHTVTMAWANRFARFRAAKAELLTKWRNDAAKNVLANKLKEVGWPKDNPALGNVEMTARELHSSCQIQHVNFGGLAATIDDMYGALGNAAVYLAVVGRVHPPLQPHVKQRGGKFIVEKLGVYIRDIYEFNENESLGLWTKEKTLGKAEIFSNATADTSDFSGEVIRASPLETVWVSNASFREWREKYGKGGDFYIFSDVEWHVPDGQNDLELE